MDAFKPFLGIGLKNYAEYQVELRPRGPVFSLSSQMLSSAAVRVSKLNQTKPTQLLVTKPNLEPRRLVSNYWLHAQIQTVEFSRRA